MSNFFLDFIRKIFMKNQLELEIEKVLIGCKRDARKVVIPYGVTSIGVNAFWGCMGLTSITIPDSVRSIEDGAFCGCIGLKSITIPDSVTSIGDFAFA